MERSSDSSLIIGVATSTAERVQLVRLLGGALLLVSNAEQARAFLELTALASPAGPVVLAPTVLPGAEQPVVAQIEAVPRSVPSLPVAASYPLRRPSCSWTWTGGSCGGRTARCR
jgi:hypothetical protein